jgi:hypothetical protein
MKMSRRRLDVDWNMYNSVDFELHLRAYRRYLEDLGFRESTIDSYTGHLVFRFQIITTIT